MCENKAECTERTAACMESTFSLEINDKCSFDRENIFPELGRSIKKTRSFILNSKGLKSISGYKTGSIALKSKTFINHAGEESEGVINNCDLPCLIFEAAEGCFSYFGSDLDFEYMLLESIMDAGSRKDWEKLLLRRLGPVSGSDFSFRGAFLGFGSFKNVQEFFVPRIDFLLAKYIIGDSCPA